MKHKPSKEIPNLLELRRRIAQTSDIWQHDLLDTIQFAKFCRERNHGIFSREAIESLWRVGLIRADLIKANREIKRPALTLLFRGEANGYYYTDLRPIRHRSKGYGDILAKGRPIRRDIQPYFHPYRLYVCYQVLRVFRSTTSDLQYLRSREGIARLEDYRITRLDKFTSEKDFSKTLNHWNEVAELAICLEPIYFQRIFQKIVWRNFDSLKTTEQKIQNYKGETMKCLHDLSEEALSAIMHEICTHANALDQNKLLHVLLRLSRSSERLKLHNSIGACITFLSMAETIRRFAEERFGKQFPEEDERGFGQWLAGGRLLIYGTERVLDADHKTRRHFLTTLRLDYGVKTRCYVEGDTELGALNYAVRNVGGIEVINLGGQAVEKRGRGLSFRESLENDRSSNVFSFVILDGDKTDLVKVVRKAAHDEIITGGFFISEPDFEIANFSIAELVRVYAGMAVPQEATEANLQLWSQKIAGVKTGKEFFERAAGVITGGEMVRKGEAWGESLMNYASANIKRDENFFVEEDDRPITKFCRMLVFSSQSRFLDVRRKYRIDAVTGLPIERTSLR